MGSLFSDIGNAIGYASSGAQRGRESRFAGDALKGYQDLNPAIRAQTVGDPYANLSSNTTDVGAAQGALKDLQGISEGTGLTPQEASALQASQLSNAQQQGAAVRAALDNAARSGTLNSGRALAGVLGAGQGATNANAQAGAEAAANSAAQRMAAMGEAGRLGQSLEGQQYGEQLQRAAGTTGVGEFNAGQDLAAQQAQYNNQLNQARGEQSAYGTLIGLNQNQAGQQQQLGSNLGDAAGQIGSAIAGVPGVGSGGGIQGLMGLFKGGGGGGQSYTDNPENPGGTIGGGGTAYG